LRGSATAFGKLAHRLMGESPFSIKYKFNVI
jgi:hypothetical protein